MCARPIEACRFTEWGVPTLIAAGVAQEQEPQHLHDAVDPLHVRRLGSGVLASRGLEIGCDNGERVRVAVALDCCGVRS